MSVHVHDPEKDFVRSHATTAEYAQLLQQTLKEIPDHVPAGKRVALAHLLVLERTVKDPVEQARARAKRMATEAKLNGRTPGGIILA